MAAASDLRIHPVKMVKHADINPSAYNPRKISASKFAALVQSIRVNGFVEPLVVQLRGMALIGGHQRYRALGVIAGAAAGATKIPVVILDISDREAKILNIALNNTEGSFDDDLLKKLMADINSDTSLSDSERLATGFTDTEINRLLVAPAISDDGGKSFASSVTLSLQFDSVTERDAVKGLLAEASNRLNKKSGTVIRDLLERSSTPEQRKKAKKAEGTGADLS